MTLYLTDPGMHPKTVRVPKGMSVIEYLNKYQMQNYTAASDGIKNNRWSRTIDEKEWSCGSLTERLKDALQKRGLQLTYPLSQIREWEDTGLTIEGMANYIEDCLT